MEEYQGFENIFELHLPDTFDMPKTLADLDISAKFLVTVVAINFSAKKQKIFVPRSSDVISAKDDIAVVGKEERIRKLAQEYALKVKPALEAFAEGLAVTAAGMAETVVSPRSCGRAAIARWTMPRRAQL